MWLNVKHGRPRKRKSSSAPVRRNFIRPLLEILESRLAPATHTWTGASLVGANWSDANNWAEGAPAAAEANVSLLFPAAVGTFNNNDIQGLTVAALQFTASGYVISGDDLTFRGDTTITDNAAGVNTIDLTLDQEAFSSGASAFFDHVYSVADGATLAVSGQITGAPVLNSLHKTGPGTLVLANALNNYGGDTLVDAGRLAQGSDNAVPPNPCTVALGATLDLNGFSATLGSLTGPGNVAVPDGSHRILPGGVVSAAVAFGPSGQVLEVVTNDGVLEQVDATGAHTLVNNARSAAVAFGPSGEVLEVVGQNGSLTQFDAAGSHPVLPGGVISAAVAFGPSGQVLEIVTSDGVLEQVDASGFHPLDNNVRSAAVAFGPSGEVLEVVGQNGSLTQLDATGSHPILPGGVVSAAVAFGPSGQVLEVVTNDGVLEQIDATGAHTVADKALSAAVAFGPSGEALEVIFQDGGLIEFDTQTLTTGVDNTSTMFSGVMSGTGNLIKVGSGTFTLAAVNTYSGATSVQAGTLAEGIDYAWPLGPIDVALGATLDLHGFNATVGSLAGAGNVDFPAGSVRTLTTGADNTSTMFSGVISGPGNLTKVGTGTFMLGAVNTYSGATAIQAGTIAQGIDNAVPLSPIIVAIGATFDLNGHNATIGSLAGAGQVMLSIDPTLTTGGDNTSTTFSGVISGVGGLTKVGAGTFILAGANTYTGPTAVVAGTLRVTGSLSPDSALSVSSGAVLDQPLVVSTTLDETTAGDSATSLREAITYANNNPNSTITFDIPTTDPNYDAATGSFTMMPESALPAITAPVTIDGYSQPGASVNTNGPGLGSNAVLTIDLDGSLAGVANGLVLSGGNSTVTGLAINHFSYNGIDLIGAGGTVIAGDFIGTDISGTAAAGNANSGIFSSAANLTIGGTTAAARNIIAANRGYGNIVIDSAASGNLVQGNFIGTDKTGTVGLGISPNGIAAGGLDVIIGGTTAAARNLISGNNGDGVSANATGALVQGNYIGTDVTGTFALDNAGHGVILGGGASSTIGGTASGAGNVISGNAETGVLIITGANHVLVQGNFIGTDVTGTKALGNQDGVDIGDPFPGTGGSNTIGGTTAAARNLISGNKRDGIGVGNAGSGNLVQGNYIGTDVTGTKPLGNGGEGVNINGGGPVIIGGAVAGAGNVISANSLDGVATFGLSGSLIVGNFIGTDVTGTAPLGNGLNGLITSNGANNTIGGTTALARNIIAANGLNGVRIGGSTQDLVVGNYIGRTDVTEAMAMGNGDNGIYMDASGNTIGGTTPGAANVISGNGTANLEGPFAAPPAGIVIDGYAGYGIGNLVQGNLIGTAADGSSALGNVAAGVVLEGGASSNTVQGNTIAFNTNSPTVDRTAPGHIRGGGVVLVGGGTGNAITANSIFANSGLGIDLGADGVTQNTAGGPHTGPNNLQNFPVLTSASAVPSVPPVANALLFDGSDDFVAVPGAPSLDVAGAITLEAWINPQTVAVSFGDIISRRTSPTKGDVANYAFRQEDNRLEFYFTAAGAFREYFSDPVLVANEWQHVAATFDPSTQQIRFYVDGVLVSMQTTPYTLTTYPDTPLTLGAVWTNATEVFPGSLAEIRIWNSARSQSQIVADAARTSSNADPALVGYWHFDEGSGTTAFDQSGNHNDGIFGGGSSVHRPVYAAVVPDSGGGNTVIAGTLNSTPNTAFQLEFFANAATDPSGHGQGQTYLGTSSVTTDANTGNASFTVILPVALPAGQSVISATATDPAGDTSEFSADAAATVAPVAVAQTFSTSFNTPLSFATSDLIANDIGTAPLAPALVMKTSHGSLVLNGDNGYFTYTPDSTFFGNDSFTYQDTDPSGLQSNVVTDTISVAPPAVTISGAAFHDINGDGTQQESEANFPGWIIDLIDSGGNTVQQQTTDPNGTFSFTNVAPGTYTVQEEKQSGWVQTSTPQTYSVTATSGTDISGLLFGNFQTVTISGSAFNDLNGDGVQGDGEPGAPGWIIDLVDSQGNTPQEWTTNADGNFSFKNVGPGAFTVRAETQAGWVQTSTPQTYSVTTSSGVDVDGEVFGNLRTVAATTTAVDSDHPDGSFFLQNVVFTATVSSDGGTPTGTVQFTIDESNYGDSVPLMDGTATIADAALDLGRHTVLAIYSSDSSSFSDSDNLADPWIQTVNPATTTTTVTSDHANGANLGQTLVFTAAVTADAGTPTGTVQFIIDDSNYGAPVTLSSGTASIADAALSVGRHNVVAVYTSDSANFLDSDNYENLWRQTVNAASTATAVTSDHANGVTFGQTVVFTATVTSDAGTPTGTVQFIIDEGNYGLPMTLSDGTASIGVATLSVGTHSVVAVYASDSSDFNGSDNSSSPWQQTVNGMADLQVSVRHLDPATLKETGATAVTGQRYVYQVTITNAGPQDATNVVLVETTEAQFFSIVTEGIITQNSSTQESIAFSSLAVNASVTATITDRAAAPGTYIDTASATADQINPQPADATKTVTETVATPTAHLQVAIGEVTPTPGLIGRPYSYTVTVTNAGPDPASNVVLLETTDAGARLYGVTTVGVITANSPTQDSIAFGPLAANASVTATIAATAAAPGTYTDTASASADELNPEPADATKTVTETVRYGSTTFLAAPAAWVAGQTVVFTAVVKGDTAATAAPTGTVTFTVDGTARTPAPLIGAIATFSTSSLSAGPHSVVAVYSGDASFAAGSSITLAQKVATTAALKASAVRGNRFIFTATVAAPGSAMPTGTVMFMDGKIDLGTATLDSSGKARLLLKTPLPRGHHAIHAVYAGDRTFASSTSRVLPLPMPAPRLGIGR